MAGDESDEGAVEPTLDDVFQDDEPKTPEKGDDDSKEKGDEDAGDDADGESEEKPDGEKKPDDDSSDAGDDKTDDKTTGESPSPKEAATLQGLQATVLGERRRRQKLETENERLRAEAEKASAPDPEADPEGHREWLEKQTNKVEWNSRVKFSRKAQMALHEDYETVESAFFELATDEAGTIINQALVDQMRKAEDPGEFVYQYMKDYRDIADWSDPAKRRALIAAEIEKAIEVERLAKGGKPDGKVGADGVTAERVPDMTKAAASASNSTPVEKEGTVEESLADAPLDRQHEV